MTRTSPNRPLAVALLALPESTPAALFAVLEVISSVGVAWQQITGKDPGVAPMAARIVARSRDPLPMPFGPAIQPQDAIAEVPAADVVVVTDLNITKDIIIAGRWPAEAEWVRAQYRRGALLCAVCTGSLFLAETGLLDGREATTHWAATEIFARDYPQVLLRPERILCPDGPAQRIVTGGGASSWADLVLYLVARFRGAEEARRIAKIFLLGDHSEGQLVFSALGKPRDHEDRAIGDCQSWIADNYAGANPVRRMIERSGLAERTFKRRFKQATGYSPVDYVQALRVEEAKQLLESSDRPTDAVAHAVGYEDPAFFRRLFKRRTGVTPGSYRRRFRPIGGGLAGPEGL